jgi:putative ABC transport system permease protein
MTIEGGNPWQPGDAPLVEYRWILGGYFKTMGVPLLRGRLFNEQDRAGTQAVIVINQAMADKFWPGQDPIGKRVAQGGGGAGAVWRQVIGVVGSVRSYGLERDAPYEMYQTLEQQPFGSMTIVMRTRGDDAGPSLQAARQILAAIDPGVPLNVPQSMEQVVAASVGRPRLMSALSSLFGALAGLLAMVGVYGVTAYNVRRQRREFGIRLALGAAPRTVQRLVIGRGILVALAGVALGVCGALVLTRTLQSMLNDVRPIDPAVFTATAVVVLLVSILACYLPARAAGRVDPMVVLRDA